MPGKRDGKCASTCKIPRPSIFLFLPLRRISESGATRDADFRIRKSVRTFKDRIFLPVANNIGIKFPKIQTAPVKIPKELFKKTEAEPKNLLFSPKFFAFTLAFI